MLSVDQQCQFLTSFRTVVHQAFRDLFIEKKMIPKVEHIFQHVTSLTVGDVGDLNLFKWIIVPLLDTAVGTWYRSILYQHMKSIGFLHGEKLFHYEHTKNRDDITKMRDNHLIWVNVYRTQSCTIYYQDGTCLFNNMTSTKVWRDESDENLTKCLCFVPLKMKYKCQIMSNAQIMIC